MDVDSGTGRRDTIVAPATPPGRSALAVVRISGPDTREVLGGLFRRRGGASVPGRRPVLGTVCDRAGEAIDEGIVVLFEAPRSYTGEDLAELTLHGSPAVVREVLAAAVRLGARPAEPGEFTLRALRDGRLDLTRAEAIRDLVEADTVAQARVATRQLVGEVAEAVAPLADDAFDLLADVEAGLEFGDEEQALAESAERTAARCAALATRIEGLLAAGETARRVREGARVVLLGPPNAGKSSLFNRLVGEERVIVTDEPGTTRDLVEEVVLLEGLPIRLVDAAGIGHARGAAEAEGMRRAREAAGRAQLVLEVFDASREAGTAGAAAPGTLRVGTHADAAAVRRADDALFVSNVTGEGLPELKRAIATALGAPGDGPIESVALANERHRAAAGRAAAALRRAEQAARGGLGPELVAVDARDAVAALREVLGEVGPEELLGRIFGRFCIGK